MMLLPTVIITNLVSICAGMVVTWSSSVLPKLSTINDENPFGRALTNTEQLLISTVVSLGSAVGPLLIGIPIDRIGRKRSLIYFCGIPLCLSMATLVVTDSLLVYYIARFVIGISFGVVLVLVPIYFCEISKVSTRGKIASTMNISLTFGELLSNIIGPFVSIRILNMIIAIIPAVFVLAFTMCPESPYYLVVKNDFENAKKSIRKLRKCYDDEARKELELIKWSVEEDLKNKGTIRDLFKNGKSRRAFFICLGLFSFQQFSGFSAFLLYSTEIFRANGTFASSTLSTIAIGVVQLVASFITPLLVDRIGRKRLMMISAIGVVISEVPVGLYYFLKEREYKVDFLAWIPLVFLILLMITYCPGLGAIPCIIIGELFPTNVKAIASTFLISYCGLIAFVASSVFKSLSHTLGIGCTLWFFAFTSFLSIWFIQFYAIETRGKNFLEIQDLLVKI